MELSSMFTPFIPLKLYYLRMAVGYLVYRSSDSNIKINLVRFFYLYGTEKKNY